MATRRSNILIPASIFIILLTSITQAAVKPAEESDFNIVPAHKTSQPQIIAGQNNTQIEPEPARASLGFDQVTSMSPGTQVGLTAYDIQCYGSMARLVDWRGTQAVHFTWTSQTEFFWYGHEIPMGVAYEMYDPALGDFVFKGMGGGCHISPLTQSHPNIDVDIDGKAVISDQRFDGGEMKSAVMHDMAYGGCFFAPYTYEVPDSLLDSLDVLYGMTEDDWEVIWPRHEYHIWDNDTVVHLIARNLTGCLAYFRKIGDDSVCTWDPTVRIIDTVMNQSHSITASRINGDVAIVWSAPLPEIVGDGESYIRGAHDYTNNDVYCMISHDMGVTWDAKINISQSDPALAGFRAGTDLSCLYDSNGFLHVIWSGREFTPAGGGTYPHYYGSRLFHWDNFNDEIRVIKDANWDVENCYGDWYSDMSICKMQLAECDGKLYALFVQFNDIYSGIDDDCHISAFTDNQMEGTANGELFLAVSDNGGFNWDAARNLTNTYTPYCDTNGTSVACESDMWPSISRYGMQCDIMDYPGVTVVDPSGTYAGDHYLDVFYLNDKFPGSVAYDMNRVWTMNPLLWFRLPCVEPEYGDPIPPPIADVETWTMPGEQKDTIITFNNWSPYDLIIDSLKVVEQSGPPGWLDIGDYGPITIPPAVPDHYNLDVYLNVGGVIGEGGQYVQGYIIAYYAGSGYCDTIGVYLSTAIVDNLLVDIRTECLRVNFANDGNIGNGGNYPYGNYNMNYFDDCDTTDNYNYAADDNATVYLYEASPFVCRINGMGDTVMNYAIYNADWTEPNGFKPLEGAYVDSTTYPEYQYGYSKFMTADEAIDITVEYYAPTDADSCDFIILVETITNNSGSVLNDVYLGEVMDWDIPSDTGMENGSGYDIDRKLMYCYGAEYGVDSIPNNDCVLADQRMGGYAFIGGVRTNSRGVVDPKAVWTDLNADLVYPTGGFVPGQMYNLMTQRNGYSAWETADPDSLYQDLHMVAVFGQFDLAAEETIIFYNVIASEYDDGLSGLQNTIDKAVQWMQYKMVVGRCCYGDEEYPDCAMLTYWDCAAINEMVSWDMSKDCADDPCFICDCLPGDANSDGALNIIDITFIINYLYKNGPAPSPLICSCDFDCDCELPTIMDVLYAIRYLYKGGYRPCTCLEWLDKCGPPLRK